MGHWLLQIDTLVNAYLSFRAKSEYDGLANQMMPVEPTNAPSITIEIIDLFCTLTIIYRYFKISKHITVRKTVLIPMAETDVYQNEALLRSGYLGSSPLTPTVAVTIHSLSAYQQIHRTCPCYSIEAFSKTLCHLHNVSIRLHHGTCCTDFWLPGPIPELSSEATCRCIRYLFRNMSSGGQENPHKAWL
jgi:hypothetical protein